MQAKPFPDVNQLSIVGGVVSLVFAAGRFVVTNGDSASATAIAGLAALVAGTGAVTLMRRPAPAQHPPWMNGIVPAAAAAVLGLGLAQLPIGLPWWIGLAGAAVLWLVVVLAEYLTLDPDEGRRPLATLGLGLLTYILIFVLFSALASGGARAAISATSCGLLAALLAWRLFALQPRVDIGRAGLYALAVGLLAAEVMWALGYWRVRPVTGAAVGLALFYLSVGLLGAQLRGRLPRRLWVEYGLVGLLAALLAIAASR